MIKGATVEQIAEAIDWQHHAIRDRRQGQQHRLSDPRIKFENELTSREPRSYAAAGASRPAAIYSAAPLAPQGRLRPALRRTRLGLSECRMNALHPWGGVAVFPPDPNAASLGFEELDEFFMSDRAPEDCMQLSELDGLLTAVAIGPELIMPSEWLPVIWGEGEPEFESAEEAQSVIGAIMARYNEILHLIQGQPDDYEPFFWETPDGEALAGDWAEGFMAGVALRRSSWQPLLESEEDGGLLAPIVAFLHDEEGNSLIQGETDQLAEVQKIALELVAPSVQDISNYWRAHRPRHEEH